MPVALSVVIPTWCEAERIASCVARAFGTADEVVVVDAESSDGTAECARRAGARVLTTVRSRGVQLHAGARAARGDVLLFLHADTAVSVGARTAIDDALADESVVGGNLRLRFSPATRWSRVYERGYDMRRRLFSAYYGDSAIFVRRSVYERLGGFAPMPLFEDCEFVRRLERTGRTAYLRHVDAVTSSRRFASAPVRSLVEYALLSGLYDLGVPSERLAAMYRHVDRVVAWGHST